MPAENEGDERKIAFIMDEEAFLMLKAAPDPS